MVEPERIRPLNDKPVGDGRFVLYWMQASQRAEWNHALEFAVRQANGRRQPVVALFGITDAYPEANERHYAFLLEGLRETRQALAALGIQLVVRHQPPQKAAAAMAGEASLVVTDAGYTRHQKAWRRHVADEAPCRVVQVESDAVVPVGGASGHGGYPAAPVRPRLSKHIDRFLVPMRKLPVRRDSLGLRLEQFDIEDVDAALARLRVDRSVGRQSFYVGGTSRAKAWLRDFIRSKLDDYAELRGDPSLGIQSNLSPYLHFGQISPLYVARRVQMAGRARAESREAFLEELIVRRELSVNFAHYNPAYDSFQSLPPWARATLGEHGRDLRLHRYTPEDLEQARTHDPYWNAAMTEMRLTGKMHNYMRMYWGKKILEWSASPEEAFRTALWLNNKYFIDGRDPNSYAGVAWCFGKHDRPWQERAVFGKVRYMNAAGLRRKFHIDTYVRQVEELCGEERSIT